MTGLQPPGVPVFYPGFDTTTQLNSGIFTGGQTSGVRDTLTFLNHRPMFRARRLAAQTVAENVHQYVIWDTIDSDNYAGGTAGSSVYTCQAPGWYLVCARVSLLASAAGAANLVLIPSIAVNGASPTGQGAAGWEGPEIPVPTGAGNPKCVNGVWPIYASVGDAIQLDLWYSTESTITSTDTTAGFQPSISLVWSSK